MNEKEQFFEDFNNGLHRIGRIMTTITLLLLMAVPFVVAGIYGTSIDAKGFWAGFAKVAIIYVPVAIVEFLVYAPMLGVGGSYLSFITGNVTNMKIPCAINARDIADTQVGTPEHEIISTISTATSAIVTTLVIVVGVVLMVPLQPLLRSEALLPAFNNVVPLSQTSPEKIEAIRDWGKERAVPASGKPIGGEQLAQKKAGPKTRKVLV